VGKADWHHLYNTKAWYRLRSIQLRDHPFCAMCMEDAGIKVEGREVQLEQCLAKGIWPKAQANIADHIKAHKGDEALFFDPDNLQSLCKTHHDGAKAKFERSGVVIGCDADGWPKSKNHHWNK
jgi:5-methylcytosine-specific restriction protein A